MRMIILATAAILSLGSTIAAQADDFAGQADAQGYGAAVKQQATDAEMADPTASNSLRSHGHP